MGNLTGGSVRANQDPPKFEGFEQRLLDELKLMVAERRIDVLDPTPVPARRGPRPGIRWMAGQLSTWRRAGLVASAGLVAGGIAVAATLAGGSTATVAGPGREHAELTTFLTRAAIAAKSRAVALPKPGQVFVERLKAGETGPNTEHMVRCFLVVYGTPATGRATFPTKSGPCGAGGTLLTPNRSEVAVESPHSGGAAGVTLKPDHGAHGYPDPARLPTAPAALLAALKRAASLGHWGSGSIDIVGGGFWSTSVPRNATVFELIERLLQVPIRPALRAALFEVTGRLPGITLDRHATDLIGRPGVGISLPLPVKGSPDGLQLVFVLNPKTYQFLGFAMTDSIDGNPANPAKYGYAVTRSSLITPKSVKH